MPENTNQEEPQVKKKPVALIAAVGGVAVIAIVVAAVTVGYMLGGGEKAEASEEALAKIIPQVFELEPFTCNLKPSGMDEMWLYNATLNLQLKPSPVNGNDEKVKKELQDRLDQVRYIITNCISNRTKDMLKTPEGRDALRQEIIREVNSVLSAGEIERVYLVKSIYTMA